MPGFFRKIKVRQIFKKSGDQKGCGVEPVNGGGRETPFAYNKPASRRQNAQKHMIAARPEKSEYSAAFFLLCLSYFALWLAQSMSGSTAALCAQRLGAGGGAKSAAAALFFVGAALSRPVAGWLSDRGKGGAASAAGTAVFFAAALTITLTGGLKLFVICRFFQGLGCSGAQTAMLTIAAEQSPGRRIGEGMSLVGLGQALAMGISTFLALGLLATPDGVSRLYLWSSAAVAMSFVLGLFSSACRRRTYEEKSGAGSAALFSARAVPTAAIQLASSMAGASCLSYMTLYAGDRGLDGGAFFAISAAVMLITRFAAGRISIKTGELSLLFPAAILSAVGLAVLPAARVNAVFFASAALFGAGSGALSPMLSAVAVKSGGGRGASMATMLLGADLGLMIGAAVWGATMGKPGYGYIYSASSLIMMAVGVQGLRLKRKQKKGGGYVIEED